MVKNTRRNKIGWLAYQAESPTIDEGLVTDVQFELSGHSIPVDNGYALFQAICKLMPWLPDEELAGVHSIHAPEPGLTKIILNRRARLSIRIPRTRVQEILALSGQSIEIDGVPLLIGAGKMRPFTRHTPLFAHCVSTGSDDETVFAADIIRLLDEMEIDSRFICGRRQSIRTADGVVSGYSLMLHGLPVEHSILVQQRGLGNYRKIGCGVFIPHKSITALT